MSEWSFLTNHARVLACIARDPEVRLRDIALTLNITERSVFRIVDDLTLGGYVTKEREGRRNRYKIQVNAPLGDALDRERTIGDLVTFLVGPKSAKATLKAELNGAAGNKVSHLPGVAGQGRAEA